MTLPHMRLEVAAEFVRQGKYENAAQAYADIASAYTGVDLLVGYELRLAGALCELVERGVPNPVTLQRIEELAAGAVSAVDYEDRTEIAFAPIGEMARLYRAALLKDKELLRRAWAESSEYWVLDGGSIQAMTLLITLFGLLTRQEGAHLEAMQIALLREGRLKVAELLQAKTGLHNHVSEALVIARSYLECFETCTQSCLSCELGISRQRTIAGGLWLMILGQLATTSTTRREIVNEKYVVHTTNFTVVENNHASITIDGRSITFESRDLKILEDAERQLLSAPSDASAVIQAPANAMVVAQDLLTRKVVTEAEFGIKFPFLSAAIKRTVTRESP